MASKTVVACDNCDKDISEGEDRNWRFAVYVESIPVRGLKAGARLDPNIKTYDGVMHMHFCDHSCCMAFMGKVAAAHGQAGTAGNG